MEKEKNYAYVTLLTNDGYFPGAIILKESLKSVKTKYPLLCMVTPNVSLETTQKLEKAGIKPVHIDLIEFPEIIAQLNSEVHYEVFNTWRYCLSKLNCFTFTQYDKLIFLDADLLILKNLDHCFEMPHMTAAFDGEYRNLWPRWPHFNSGFMVIEPSIDEFNKILDFINNLNPYDVYDFRGDHYVLADQELLNLYYSNWKNEPEKHLNKYYNVFAPHLVSLCDADLVDNAYFIHFVGTKPWALGAFVSPMTDKYEYSYYFYILAFAIYRISEYNKFGDIDWDMVKATGWLDAEMIVICLDKHIHIQLAMFLFARLPKTFPTYNHIKALLKTNHAIVELIPVVKKIISLSRQNVLRDITDPSTLIPDLHYTEYLQWLIDEPTEDRTKQFVVDFWQAINTATEEFLRKVGEEHNF